ncbi:PhnA domain-containing protein [Dyadobacter endophyticus]|uniref:PhnA domain-containing protein n=1 Tax=Dyadobacter endophyticus TaxID=1749036 RepID=UPI003CED169F
MHHQWFIPDPHLCPGLSGTRHAFTIRIKLPLILTNSVTLIKQTGQKLTRSLAVRGSSLNARMGTVVKDIRVVEDNAEQIEGKIDGQLIVILTKYLRKQA